uniref:Ig-like domain-containing protein n=1 Tax=Sinocyclocheilus anshuiensis TaxID=1608454 RepID=A0A671KA38_9TELE
MLMTYFFLSIFPVSSAQDRIEQTSREMTESEGAQVILMCNYTTASTNPYLFWYKRLPNRSPTFILNQYTTEPDFTKKYSATLNSTPRTFPLMIKNLHVSDSSVYYCALNLNPFHNSTNYPPNLLKNILKVCRLCLSIIITNRGQNKRKHTKTRFEAGVQCKCRYRIQVTFKRRCKRVVKKIG